MPMCSLRPRIAAPLLFNGRVLCGGRRGPVDGQVYEETMRAFLTRVLALGLGSLAPSLAPADGMA